MQKSLLSLKSQATRLNSAAWTWSAPVCLYLGGRGYTRACFGRFLMRCDDLSHIKADATPRALCRVALIFTCPTTEWEGWKSMALTLMSVRLSVSISATEWVWASGCVSGWECECVCVCGCDGDVFVIVVTPLRIHQDVWLNPSGINIVNGKCECKCRVRVCV